MATPNSPTDRVRDPNDKGIYSYSHAKWLTEKFVAQELEVIDARARRQGELPLTQEPADVYADLFARCAAQPTINPETT